MKDYLSLDIGGTFTKFAVIKENGQLSHSGKKITPKKKTALYQLIDQLVTNSQCSFSGVGISCPGRVDSQTGQIAYGGALPFLHGISLKQDIEEKYHVPCNIINDGKAAAVAEFWLGNLKNVENGVAIILGTGVGGGIISGGRLLMGSHFQAGELSFMLNTTAVKNKHNLVGFASSAVEFVNRASKLLGNGVPGDGKLVFAELEKKNEIIFPLFAQYCQGIATIVINLQAVLDIEKIVIGGGISLQPLLLKEINDQYQQIRQKISILENTLPVIDIEACQFKHEANLLGAVYSLING